MKKLLCIMFAFLISIDCTCSQYNEQEKINVDELIHDQNSVLIQSRLIFVKSHSLNVGHHEYLWTRYSTESDFMDWLTIYHETQHLKNSDSKVNDFFVVLSEPEQVTALDLKRISQSCYQVVKSSGAKGDDLEIIVYVRFLSGN